MLDLAALCLVATALLAWLNHRFVGLPTTIGVMAAALLLSGALILLDASGVAPGLRTWEESALRRIDFTQVLLDGMLSLLLFSAALQANLGALRRHRLAVALLALGGTLGSALLVGLAAWWLLPLVGLSLPLVYCLLFGALIGPTDPVAVVALVRQAGAPKGLETVIAGESMFNDGVGIALFVLLLGALQTGHWPQPADALALLAREAGGGITLGLVLGGLGLLLLRSIDQCQLEVLLMLALVAGGYALAQRLHLSGPLAMVAAGLVVANGRSSAMSAQTQQAVDLFWEVVDEILNAVLFLLIGLEVVLVSFGPERLAGIGLAIGVTLAARALAVGVPVAQWPRAFSLPAGSWKVITWGGLRGGIGVALALSLPRGDERDSVVALTYGVVVFSVIVQGLTIGRVTRLSLR